MTILIVVIHVIVCLFLIGVVLLQSGKSGDLAAAFGGQGSQTAFGPRGAASVLSRATTWSAIIFMFTSITLSVFAARRTGPTSVLSGVKPAPTKSQPAAPAAPPTVRQNQTPTQKSFASGQPRVPALPRGWRKPRRGRARPPSLHR